jgi:tol-pal system protein YbgF
MNCITRRSAPPIALLAVALMAAAPLPAAAADKEQQQMMADIRMLQEQTQFLANMLRSVTDALTAMSAKIDEQAGADRKAAADSKLTIDALTSEVRVIREKLDDNGVRLSSLTQEVDAMRQSIQQVPLSRLSAGGAPDVPAPRAADGAAALPTVPVGTSPNRLWESAMADYSASQWNLAIQGFESYLRTFPTYDKADDAQVYIGHSYFGDGKFDKAIEAYDKAIRAYPSADAIPDAYYRKGVALANLMQTDEAQQTWDALIATFPTSDAAVLAKQRIDQLKKP